jgi:ferrous-iron efflux pump FieF
MASMADQSADILVRRASASRLLRAATVAAVVLATVLIAVKLVAWLATSSVAVLSSLVDSLLDSMASLVSFFAVRHALTPADDEHRFGHGKAEPLAALGQAAFVAGSAALIVLECINHLYDPRPVTNEALGIVVMSFSIAATVALVQFQQYVVRRTQSLAIRADSLHYSGDVLLNGSVLLSLVITAYADAHWVDPLFGFGIAVYMVWNAKNIGLEALHMLMDRELPDADRERIRAIALAHPEIRAVHDLRSRASGRQLFIQMHLEMSGAMLLSRAHVVADEVENEVLRAFPGAEVIIHQDPDDVVEPHRNLT